MIKKSKIRPIFGFAALALALFLAGCAETRPLLKRAEIQEERWESETGPGYDFDWQMYMNSQGGG